ncbi:MAG: hypothetical protein KatS3mg027_0220 [Bacteroidia bacterium]|nr:MAG: hypothetical protein KatS3mg027_0220 [Bacteroidia bacterium]
MRFSSVTLFFIYSRFFLSQNWDVNALYFLQNHRNAGHYVFFQALTNSEYSLSMAEPISYWSSYLKTKQCVWKQRGIQSIVSITTNATLIYGLKYLINRERPYEKYSFLIPLQKERSPSFPSGHTGFAFRLATAISLNFPKWYWILPA